MAETKVAETELVALPRELGGNGALTRELAARELAEAELAVMKLCAEAELARGGDEAVASRGGAVEEAELAVTELAPRRERWRTRSWRRRSCGGGGARGPVTEPSRRRSCGGGGAGGGGAVAEAELWRRRSWRRRRRQRLQRFSGAGAPGGGAEAGATRRSRGASPECGPFTHVHNFFTFHAGGCLGW